MQVSTALESDNYAIVGGGKAREFKISASSHAFKIMTDALYQDKPYAVARETICNATDAHIMGGIPERPIEISLSDTQFIVKDFGPGIHDDNIQDTYCTLFGSTKSDDDRQTGGFGLGCKAPFSMTDHFMVISCHKGIKSTYAMTVGNDETDGKPAAQLMSSVKTTETGLTVIIPIEPDQRTNFDRAIRRTVQDGGIKATIDGANFYGTVRDYTGIEKAGFGFFKSSRWTTSRVAILYGNVLYPMDEHEGTRDILRDLVSLLRYSNYQLVLYAPPSSVTPKPDRESLGYNDKTLVTINRIAHRAYHQIKEQMPGATRDLVIAAMEGVQRHNYANLFWDGIAAHMPNPYDPTGEGQELSRIGAKAVARALTYSRFTSNYFGTVETVHRIAADVYRDHRKDLLNCKDDLLHAQHRYLLRRLMRAVLPVVPRPTLRYRVARNSGKLFAKIPSVKTRFPVDHKPQLTLTPTSSLMLDSDRAQYVIITAGLKAEEIKAIAANAERFGFDVKILEKPEKKVVRVKEKEVRVSHFFTPFDAEQQHLDRNRGYSMIYRIKDPVLVKPDAFVAPSFERRRIVTTPKDPPYGIGPVQPRTECMTTVVNREVYQAFDDMLGSNRANIAMPRNIEERDRLLAAGVPRFLDKLLIDLKSKVDFTSQEQAFLAAMSASASKGGLSAKHHDKTARFASIAVTVSREVASAVFMQPFTDSEEMAALYKTWCQVHRAFSMPRGSCLDAVEYEAWKRSQTEYRALMDGFDPYLPQEIRQFFARLRKGKIEEADVLHLKFLGELITDTYRMRLLEQPIKERLAELIRTEGDRYLASSETSDNIQPIENEEEDWL